MYIKTASYHTCQNTRYIWHNWSFTVFQISQNTKLHLLGNIMAFLVSFHQCLCHKVFLTYVTVVWSVTCVIALVNNQGGTLCKCLSTEITWVWTFTSVHPHMYTKVWTCVKSLSTYITDHWLLTGVNAVMLF